MIKDDIILFYFFLSFMYATTSDQLIETLYYTLTYRSIDPYVHKQLIRTLWSQSHVYIKKVNTNRLTMSNGCSSIL